MKKFLVVYAEDTRRYYVAVRSKDDPEVYDICPEYLPFSNSAAALTVARELNKGTS